MRIGDLIAGRYRIDGAIGAGGMGSVWRAHDVTLRRDVAIKRANDGEILREARIGAGIRHPNVATVHDVFEEAGEWWLVMEYVPATSLAEALRDGPLTPVGAARLGLEIADALAAMHAKGIVHRDVTPANILLAEDGTAKIIDLGIARWNEVTLTGSAWAAGTPGYVAPEVRRGDGVTPASDMYSLGRVLSAALGGVEPNPLARVLDAMTDDTPARRPTADEARALLLGVRPKRRRVIVMAAAALAAALVVSTVLLWPTDEAPRQLSGPEFVGDPATADLCRLADPKVLERYGPVTVDSDYGDLTRCSYLVAVGGDEDNVVNVSVWLEDGPEPDSGDPARRVSDGQTVLDRREPGDNYCQLYIHLPVEYRVGITAEHVDGRKANLCPMADVLVDSVYATLDRGRLPRRTAPEPDSLGARDACALLDSRDVAGPLAAEGVRAQHGFAGWQCMWIAQGGNRRVLVSFNRVGADYDEGVRATFAGRTAFVEAEGWGETKCLVSVVFRPYVSVDNDEDRLEMIQIFFRSNDSPQQRCVSASALATAVAERL